MAISCRPKPLIKTPGGVMILRGINPSFPGLFPCKRQVPYAVRTRAPVVSGVQALPVTPRLACVRPAASVHPEPGSNSSSLSYKYIPPTTKNPPGPVSRFKILYLIYGTASLPFQIRCLYNISMNS